MTVLLFLRNLTWLKKVYNCLILALAIQDILISVCIMALPGFLLGYDAYKIPTDATARWIFCKLLWSHFIPFALGIASVYTCLMLTFDRWLAVVKPLSYKRYEHSKIVVFLTILFPWIAGMCFEISAPLRVTSTEVNGTFVCHWMANDHSPKTISLAIFTFLGMIVIPGVLMVVIYAVIIVNMKRSKNRVSVVRNNSEMKRHNSALAVKRVTIIAFFASVTVIVCWLPDQIYYTLSHVQVTELGTTVHFAVKILAFANSCFNPAIYCFSNKAYRRGIREVLGCFCCKVPLPVSEFSMAASPTTS